MSVPTTINGYVAPLSSLPPDIHREFLRVANAFREVRDALNAIQSGGDLTLAKAKSIKLTTSDGKGTITLSAAYDTAGKVVLRQD